MDRNPKIPQHLKRALLLLLLAHGAPAQTTVLDHSGDRVYRRSFELPSSAATQHVRVRFDSVLGHAKAFVNGQLLGEHDGGYTPFEFDLSGYVKAGGVNTLVVESDGGLAGDVAIVRTPRVYAARLQAAANQQQVAATLLLRNTLDNTTNVDVRFEVLRHGKLLGSAEVSTAVPALLTQAVETTVMLRSQDVQLWDPEHPNLYTLRAVISKDAEAAEGAYRTEASVPFGIRTIELRDGRMLLNGEAVHLGGATHFGTPLTIQDLRLMKEAGMVFCRIGRYPWMTTLLDWADQNGMLLMEDSGPSEIAAKLERDGNHPSLVAWNLNTPEDAARVRRLDAQRLAFPAGAKPLFVEHALRSAAELREALGEVRSSAHVAAFAIANVKPVLSSELYAAVRAEFSPVVIDQISQVNGVTHVTIRSRPDFPAFILRGYQVQMGIVSQQIPDLLPGQKVELEFYSQNPYRTEVRSPTGFVIADRAGM